MDPEIRENRRQAAAMGIMVLGFVGATVIGWGIHWALGRIGLSLPPELIGFGMGCALCVFAFSWMARH